MNLPSSNKWVSITPCRQPRHPTLRQRPSALSHFWKWPKWYQNDGEGLSILSYTIFSNHKSLKVHNSGFHTCYDYILLFIRGLCGYESSLLGDSPRCGQGFLLPLPRWCNACISAVVSSRGCWGCLAQKSEVTGRWYVKKNNDDKRVMISDNMISDDDDDDDGGRWSSAFLLIALLDGFAWTASSNLGRLKKFKVLAPVLPTST